MTNIYATLDTVKTVLRLTDDNTVRDAELQASLDAVESWAKESLQGLGVTSTAEAPATAKFYDVAEDATLHTDPEDATVVEVRGYRRGVEFDIPLVNFEDAWAALHTGTSYEQTPTGDVLLRRNATVSPFEGVVAMRGLAYYDRVEVDYWSPGTVPKAVTEGISYLAAGHWKNGPRVLSGLVEEKIGDYSWKNEGSVRGGTVGGQPNYVREAMFFLTPFMRRTNRVMVT